MRSRFAAALFALALPLALMSACGSDTPGATEVTVTTTVPSPTATSPDPTSSAPEATTAAGNPAANPEPAAGSAPCGAVGITAAPGIESPHCLGKQIASCGDASIHQTGTTFFTDGTSGWTADCQAQMVAAYVPPSPVPEPTFDQDAYNGQFAEEYWSNNPRPTFDPDSADGYGPDQPLPPACLRLVGVDC